VTLPHSLQTGVDELIAGIVSRELERSARSLSDAYRTGGPRAARAACTSGDVAAYLATRAPATYAAVVEVFHEICAARPEWSPTSVLDLGAGPGIASWAAVETWPGIATVALVEAEPEMVRAGKTLADSGPESLRRAT